MLSSKTSFVSRSICRIKSSSDSAAAASFFILSEPPSALIVSENAESSTTEFFSICSAVSHFDFVFVDCSSSQLHVPQHPHNASKINTRFFIVIHFCLHIHYPSKYNACTSILERM